MIVLNFTGLGRTRWWPSLRRQAEGQGIWFVDFRWLQVQVTVYGRVMAAEFIRRLNRDNRRTRPVR